MAQVVGHLKDFALDTLSPYSPQIIFTASGPAIAGLYGTELLVSRPVAVTPASDTGFFSVELVPNVEQVPEGWYTISVRWLDASSSFVSVELPNWRLKVPLDGGNIGDLLDDTPFNPELVSVSTNPPAVPTDGSWWIEDTTGNLYEWSA